MLRVQNFKFPLFHYIYQIIKKGIVANNGRNQIQSRDITNEIRPNLLLNNGEAYTEFFMIKGLFDSKKWIKNSNMSFLSELEIM